MSPLREAMRNCAILHPLRLKLEIALPNLSTGDPQESLIYSF
jgi:hypothetical protein